MINTIVLGMSAKKFKEVNGIDAKVKNIRPYLNNEQVSGVVSLQRIDIGLVISSKSYDERKQLLTDKPNT